MDWRTYYKEHTLTPEQAVSVIHNGDRVVFGHAVGEPIVFQRTMARMADRFSGVEVAHMVYLGSGEYLQPGMEGHFRHNALFVGGPARKAIAENRADYTPVFFSDVPRMFRDGTLPVDVFAFTCSPPDERGYVSLGLSCDYGAQAVKSAKTVIAEVNSNMPRTYGESFVHVSEIDGFLCSWEPLPESKPAVIGEIDRKIGEHIAGLVQDGDCLQLGIGALPDAVCTFLGSKKDLGLHTEMISDGVLPLLESGVINGKRKQRDIGKVSVTFLMGTRRLYDYVNDNPMIRMLPVDVCNNPAVISQNDNVVSINSCVQVDLQGQVCAEAIGLRQISGIGGQMDFVRGANLSSGGRSIIALHAATNDESASKIVSTLTDGAPVTTSRCDVGYIVTEYGVACLRGQTLRERAKRLIAIAHPKFRKELAEEYQARFGTCPSF
ncbi:4-hydroxybutyrate CoA-transferase [Butyricicoccus faecihominis]|uniref:acetyl-CoA hydrolase/transferase family protein n=1 Tax=Butyricicoccus faecihominis TaxID=1712515 RepID=UPI0024792C13|nr:acetyl-CoA hydrolase/transferase C-terminal domain-containing protein [Butyricicoccus faecihominis]MCQ5128494.1 4-hydroxybutyrate CoA-transferase [Butyricicoccus faecihominis]